MEIFIAVNQGKVTALQIRRLVFEALARMLHRIAVANGAQFEFEKLSGFLPDLEQRGLSGASR